MMNIKQTAKKSVAAIVAAATLAGATAASVFAAGADNFALKPDTGFSIVVIDGQRYVLGAVVDTGITNNQFRQAFVNSDTKTGTDNGVSITMTGVNLNEPLRTGNYVYEYSWEAGEQTGNTAIAVVKGDVNGSGRKSISQLTALARMLSDPAQFTVAQQMAADITNDGKIGIPDLVALAKDNIHSYQTQPGPTPMPAPTPKPSEEAAFTHGIPYSAAFFTSLAFTDLEGKKYYYTGMEVKDDTVLTPMEQTEQMLKYVNDLRARNGVPPLRANEKLAEASEVRAKELASMHEISHTRPDGSSCFTAYRADTTSWAENCAAGATEKAAMEYNVLWDFYMWYCSKGHYDNMINGNNTQFGYATVLGDDGVYYSVQSFCGDGEVTWVDTPKITGGQ